MVSGRGVLVGLFIIALSVPMVFFPAKAARIRLRHARDPEPTAAAIRDARLTGVLIMGLGLYVLVFY